MSHHHLYANPKIWKYEWSKTDFTKTIVNYDDIISGGPPKDGILAIDNPQFLEIDAINDLHGNEPVVVLYHQNIAKAYPIRVLIWHEIVNDMIGDMPVTITYCPLCNSAVAFDRRVNDHVLDFGVSGKLRHSDMIMYDRQTESWWQQFLGKSIIGSMVNTQLNFVPVNMVPYHFFEEKYPNGQVLIPPNTNRPYGINPYIGYDTSPKPLLYSGDFDRENITPMQYVVIIGDKAISMPLIQKNKGYEDKHHRIVFHQGLASPLNTRDIASGRDIGFIEVFRKNEDGTETPEVFDRSFAFVFDAFHPNKPIITR